MDRNEAGTHREADCPRGLCSRREAERWIEGGRVAVDGKPLDSPAFNVAPGAIVTVDGTPIPEAEATGLAVPRPAGCLTTNRDPQGRKTIFEFLPDDLPRVMTIGRLDFNSEGLLLLTNDGDVARRLEHPNTAWRRRYRVRVHGRVDEDRLADLARGVVVDGVKYGPIEAVRAGATFKRVARHVVERGKEPRSASNLRTLGPSSHPSDTRELWAVPVGQYAERRLRGCSGESAGRAVGRRREAEAPSCNHRR